MGLGASGQIGEGREGYSVVTVETVGKMEISPCVSEVLKAKVTLKKMVAGWNHR